MQGEFEVYSVITVPKLMLVLKQESTGFSENASNENDIFQLANL